MSSALLDHPYVVLLPQIQGEEPSNVDEPAWLVTAIGRSWSFSYLKSSTTGSTKTCLWSPRHAMVAFVPSLYAQGYMTS